MRHLYLGLFLLSTVLFSSCSDEKTISQEEPIQTGSQTQFDAPGLLDLENNTSLPEKALGDD